MRKRNHLIVRIDVLLHYRMIVWVPFKRVNLNFSTDFCSQISDRHRLVLSRNIYVGRHHETKRDICVITLIRYHMFRREIDAETVLMVLHTRKYLTEQMG